MAERKPVSPQWEGVYEWMGSHTAKGCPDNQLYIQTYGYGNSRTALFVKCDACQDVFWPSPWKELVFFEQQLTPVQREWCWWLY